MCGIVGYVGAQQAAGRGDRGPAAAGVPRLRLRRGRRWSTRRAGIAVAKKAGKLANLEKALAEHPLPASTHRHRPHPLGDPRCAQRRATPTRTSGSAVGWRSCTTGSSRTSPSCGPELEADGRRAASPRPTPRSPRSCSSSQLASGVDLTGRHAARLPPAGGRVHPGGRRRARPDAGRGGAPQLAAGRRARRGRELPRLRRGGVHRAHPRGARARPGPGRHDHPRGPSRSPTSTAARRRAGATTSTGTCRPPRRTATTGSCARRSIEQPRAVADSLLGRRTAAGLLQLDEMRLSDQELRDIDKIIIIACGTVVLRRHGREVRDRALDAGSRSRSSSPPSSATATRSSTTRPWWSRSASPARPPTPCRRSGTRATQRSKVLAICNTNGSTIPRESDAVIYTHAGPEIGVASTKGFLTQLVACYLLALYLAQVKGTRYGDEIAQVLHQLEAMPGPDRAGAGQRPRRSYALAPRLRRRAVGAVPGPARRLPGRPRGRAQAQGARLPARRGVRGRRAQARPDRPDRGRPAGVLRRPSPGSRPAPRQDAQRHPGGARPRCPHHLPGRGGRRPDHAVRRRADPPAPPSRCCCSRSSRSSRCSCSRASWPP